MKNIIGCFLSIWVIQGLSAQTFQAADSTTLYSQGAGQIADADHDGVLDYVFLQPDSLRLDSMRVVTLSMDSLTLDTLGIVGISGPDFFLGDADNNSRLDILSSGNGGQFTYLYMQDDTAAFHSWFVDSALVERAVFRDMDNDGRKEIIFSTGQGQLKIKQSRQGAWRDYWVPQDISPEYNWMVYDADNDGFSDLLLTQVQADTVVTTFFQNEKGTLVPRDTTLKLNTSHLSYTDHDNDGTWDILNAGNGDSGFTVSIIRKDTSIVVAQMPAVTAFDVFSADLTSDGLVDIYLSASLEDSSTVTGFYQNLGDDVFLPGELAQHSLPSRPYFGDFDLDGDLDLLLARTETDSVVVSQFINATEEVNYGPSIVQEHVAFVIPDGFVLAWEGTVDDHTPAEAITYDMFVGEDIYSADALAGSFDLMTTKRFLTRAGNVSGRTELRVEGLSAGAYEYGIQAVDNAFHYLVAGGEGGGDGGGSSQCGGRALACGSFSICAGQMAFEEVFACFGDSIELTVQAEVAWYSLDKGYMGKHGSLWYRVEQSDTLYTSMNSCEEASSFIIRTVDENPIRAMDTLLCEGALLSLEIDGADSVFWYSDEQGFLSDSATLVFTALLDEVVTVEAFYGSCTVQDTLSIRISKMEIQGQADYTIRKGESIQLQMPVGATYEWTPDTWLDNAFSSSPVASPRSSLSYVVQATDSLMCTATDTINITVVDYGWVPDLFTPNNDGNNDQLRVYGLENVQDFKFSVYSRNGNMVYSTASISSASGFGWDGKENGKDLPAGVYLWRVEGKLDDGSPVRLNGSESGTVYMIR